ncbi:DUF4434 domain-containing protein [bacterium]|nr:DUF4434 domain-containing protein [bacterium]
MLIINTVFFILTLLLISFEAVLKAGNPKSCSLTLIPPSPVSEQITLSIRGAVRNNTGSEQAIETAVYLDHESESGLLFRETVVVPPQSSEGIYFRWPAKGFAGDHEIIFTKKVKGQTERVRRPVTVLASQTRSTGTIDGAWFGFYHWSEREGRLWNDEIKNMTDDQWRELVKAMNEIGMNIIVGQEMFRNQMYVDEHSIALDGYAGKAFYPSSLFADRMPVESGDPMEAVLSEADDRGMFVFIPVGIYAWFDFTMGSLEWHNKIATELWQRYGHHPSFYGWYVSEEIHGSLSPDEKDTAIMKMHHNEIVQFFKEFRAHVRTLAPDKPVLLASNCHHIKLGLDVYPRLLAHLDILCPFGFHRMPADDMSGEEAAALLQNLCDTAGTHLWMDMEAFLFGNQDELYPRPINGLIDDLNRFQNFEKILCYQFPGLFNAPWSSRKPGGEATVKLYRDYQRYYEKKKIFNIVQ